MKTRVTELLGSKYPIILGGMHWLGRGRLAAAVSEAGGFGLISAGSLVDHQQLLTEIELVRSLTKQPFGVNISLGYRDMEEFFEAAVAAQVNAIFTSGRNPEKHIPRLKAGKTVWVHVAPSVRHAVKAESMGADAVVIVGIEAGGHPGPDDVALMASIPKAAGLMRIPIIAAGAITNGKSLLAALAMGAEGVQIGTRFIATEECIAHANVKQLIVWADETDAALFNLKNGGRTRALKPETVARFQAAAALAAATSADDSANSFERVYRDGAIGEGLVIVGQGLGTINEILTVPEVIETMVMEAEAGRKAINTYFGEA